jgi:transposase
MQALEALYRTTKDVHIRQRAQIVLLAAEKKLVAADIAEIVRLDEQSVRRWLKRYMAEGIEGLKDAPRPGAPAIVTAEYWAALLTLDVSTAGRLSGRRNRYSRER